MATVQIKRWWRTRTITTDDDRSVQCSWNCHELKHGSRFLSDHCTLFHRDLLHFHDETLWVMRCPECVEAEKAAKEVK